MCVDCEECDHITHMNRIKMNTQISTVQLSVDCLVYVFLYSSSTSQRIIVCWFFSVLSTCLFSIHIRLESKRTHDTMSAINTLNNRVKLVKMKRNEKTKIARRRKKCFCLAVSLNELSFLRRLWRTGTDFSNAPNAQICMILRTNFLNSCSDFVFFNCEPRILTDSKCEWFLCTILEILRDERHREN